MTYKNDHLVVGIDLTAPVAQHQHGMTTIIQNLFQGTNDIGINIKLIAFCTNNNLHLYQKHKSKYVDIIIDNPKKWLEDGGCLDIIHYPFNLMPNYFNGIINLVTVCDLIPFKYPNLYPKNNNKLVTESYYNADHILTISKSVRMDIINCLGIDSSKVSHCVISSKFPMRSSQDKYLSLPDNYLVFPAAFRPHKNHARLLKALSMSNLDIFLVFSTGESHNIARDKSLIDLIKKYDLMSRVEFLGCLKRTQYHELIYRSKGIIYPSLIEGFGLPVLEGLIANKNIACSQVSSLIEVTNGKALYFNPYDENQIKNKMEILWESRDKKSDLIDRKGILEKYSIRNQAVQYTSLYKDLYRQRTEKYSPLIKNDGASIIESANALFHSSYFNEKSMDLYKFTSELYIDTVISKLIKQPITVKCIERDVNSTLQSNIKTFVLLIDVTRLFTGNPCSGISKYVSNILQQFMSTSNIVTIPFYNRKARGFRGDRNSEKNYLHKYENNSIISILAISKAIKFACHLDLPVIYFSSYHPLPERRNSTWKYCITIFDVIHLTEIKYYPNGNDRKKYITSDIVNSIIPTDMILPISRYTLNDIKNCLSFSVKASIVYLAPGIIKSEDNYKYRNIDILVPFQNDPRKGFQRMLNIVLNILENTNSSEKLKILFFGRAELNLENSFNNLISKFPNSVSFIPTPDEFKLVELYKESKCFLYLSEAEGFGMPPLEAMSCGAIPIILSNTSLGEIFSGWPYLLENRTSDSTIVTNVLKIIVCKDIDALSKSAILFASKFTWKNSRNLHFAAFSKLLGR